ncbi:MAG: chemotaxis protein CheW [Bacillota bacterium]
MMQDEEFIQGFIEEAIGHLDTVEAEIVNMDTAGVNAESINNIFRAVHSIKGTSSFFDFKKIVALSHALENVFGEARSGKLEINEEIIDILLCSNDCLRVMVNDVANSESVDITVLMDRLSCALQGSSSEKIKTSKASEQPSGSFDCSSLDLEEAKKSRILSEIERGCRLYLLKRRLYNDFINKGNSMLELLKEIQSFGSVIDCHVDLESLEGDIHIEILFTTVLEMDILPSALTEPKEDICELQAVWKAEESKPAAAEKIEERIAAAHSQSAQDEAERSMQQTKLQNVAVEDSIRVNITLLNSLLNVASEMVLARNQLLRTMQPHRKSIPGIEVILQNIDHITTNLQERVMQTRMQPVSNVFSKFPRIIRELAKKMGKDIRLVLEGSEVELDKSIIEALYDPLTHLVRNSIDHGMEMPEERTALGKPRTGTLSLKAYHESGYVYIDVIDDGRGIDLERIKVKALDNALVGKADLALMTDQEILQLIFKPGFSTSEKVTDLSGRGVGMDVVKTNIERLGGKIEIFTVQKAGTTIRLLLPLTLAIIPSLIVEVEKQKFALPQINIQEIVRIKANDPSRKIEYISNSEVMRLRGRLLPIVHLAGVLGLERTYFDEAAGERKLEKRKHLFDMRHAIPSEEKESKLAEELDEKRSEYGSGHIIRILVIKIGSRRLGLAVDTIHESEEILVKTLPAYVKECKCYSGVTILGDGKTALILDPSGIIEKANLHYSEGQDEKRANEREQEKISMYEYQSVLLFKCSGPETLAIDMSMVSRVEEIRPDDIERIGDKEFIQFRGQALRVIRPESFLPLNNEKRERGKYFVIIPKLVKHPIGILIEEIKDTVQTRINIAEDDGIKTKGVVGSSIICGSIVLLVNIYELFEMASPEHYRVEADTRLTEKVTILLAEDTPFFQRMEKDYLENAGYRVIVAQDGKEALELLSTQQIDVVVSDINMPVMSGLELVKRIRSDSKLCTLPVIALTSLTGEKQKSEGLEAGFDAYEFKLDRSRLLDIVGRIIKERRRTI